MVNRPAMIEDWSPLPPTKVMRCWKLLSGGVAVILATLLPMTTAVRAQEIDPRLEGLRPLIAKTWQGMLRSPDGTSESRVVRTFELLEKGRVIKLTKTNKELDSFGEGFIYWDAISREIRLFFVEDNGVLLNGTVGAKGKIITVEGTMTWPAPPPRPDVKQSYDFRNTFELLSPTAMRDSWFQNAFGPWRPGHVIDFEATADGDGDLSTSTLIDVSFAHASASGTDREKTLQSVLKVRDISEQYATGGLYLITQYGDRKALFEKENEELLRHPWITQPWRFCTIFSTKSDESMVIGRNWDNQNVGSVIVSRYQPSEGYASVSFARAIDLGFPLNVRIDEMAATPFGDKLLLAPFYTYDGINEEGLFAAVTGVGQVKVSAKEGKRRIFIGYLVRTILDHCRTVDEALKLVEDYVPFDLDDSSLNCHFFVADATGRSVILEYVQDSWKKIVPGKNWQVLTNKVVYETTDAVLREKCWRYKTASEELEKGRGRVDWAGGMRILKDVSQPGTTWSVIYVPKSKEIFFSVYQDWGRIYRLRFPDKQARRQGAVQSTQ